MKNLISKIKVHLFIWLYNQFESEFKTEFIKIEFNKLNLSEYAEKNKMFGFVDKDIKEFMTSANFIKVEKPYTNKFYKIIHYLARHNVKEIGIYYK